MTDAKRLYDEDFVAWSRQQAEALRAAARAGSNLQLDWENLAEEVESLGQFERRALHSQIQRIIRHLLKLEYSPAPEPRQEPRRGWVETINDARSEIELLLETSPSLTGEVQAVVAAEVARAARGAIRDLRRYGEVDSAGAARISAARHTVEQILGDWFPPEPRGPAAGPEESPVRT